MRQNIAHADSARRTTLHVVGLGCPVTLKSPIRPSTTQILKYSRLQEEKMKPGDKLLQARLRQSDKRRLKKLKEFSTEPEWRVLQRALSALEAAGRK